MSEQQDPSQHGGQNSETTAALNRIAEALEALQKPFERIASQIAPEPSEIVGTPYVSRKLDCTTVWVADMVRTGVIPKSCTVPGTGNGKPWKFYRRKIEAWIDSR